MQQPYPTFVQMQQLSPQYSSSGQAAPPAYSGYSDDPYAEPQDGNSYQAQQSQPLQAQAGLPSSASPSSSMPYMAAGAAGAAVGGVAGSGWQYMDAQQATAAFGGGGSYAPGPGPGAAPTMMPQPVYAAPPTGYPMPQTPGLSYYPGSPVSTPYTPPAQPQPLNAPPASTTPFQSFSTPPGGAKPGVVGNGPGFGQDICLAAGPTASTATKQSSTGGARQSSSNCCAKLIALLVIVGIIVGAVVGSHMANSSGSGGGSGGSGGVGGGGGGGGGGGDAASSRFGTCSTNSCLSICDSSEISCNYCEAACVYWVCGKNSMCQSEASQAAQLGLSCSSLGITCS